MVDWMRVAGLTRYLIHYHFADSISEFQRGYPSLHFTAKKPYFFNSLPAILLRKLKN
jgi:hypothetical protein